MEQKRLLIIDGHSLLFRAFHALPPLTNQQGQPTGAVYGFLLTLFKAIKDVKANCIVACFDTEKPTFRHEAFIDYKGQRPKMPEGIASQIPIAKQVLEALGIPLFEKEGFEADDLIATIAEQAKKDAEVFIVSGDLDTLQLVDDKVKVYTLGKSIREGLIYDAGRVRERFGVTPAQMNDFKALTGDASDNIPGVPGIGKTTAADLISRFGSVKQLYQEMETDTALLKPKIKEALKQNKEKAFLSLDLVVAKKDVALEFSVQKCVFGTFDKEKVKTLFQVLEFNSLIEKLPGVTIHL